MNSLSSTSTYIIFNSLTRFLWWILITRRSILLIIARTSSCIRSTGLSIRLIVAWTLSWIRTSWLSACLIIDRILSYISSSLRWIYQLLFFLSFWSWKSPNIFSLLIIIHRLTQAYFIVKINIIFALDKSLIYALFSIISLFVLDSVWILQRCSFDICYNSQSYCTNFNFIHN